MRGILKFIVALALVTTAVTVPGVLPAMAASAWIDGDELTVARMEINPLGDAVAVHLRWPAASSPVDGFQVVRDGAVVTNAGPTATGATDPGVFGAGKLGFRYEVRALSGTTVIDTLGPIDIAFPAAGSECTKAWTGAAGSSWHQAANWATVGVEAAEPGVPAVGDHACATTTKNWPITVDQADAVTKHFTSTLSSSLPTLRVATGGTLAIGGALKSYSLQLAGGDLTIAEDSLLIEGPSRAPLELGGGTLHLGGTLRGTHPTNGSLQGAVVAVADTTTTLDGGRIEMELLRFDTDVKKTVIGIGGVEVAAPIVRLNGTTNFEAGAGGARLLAGTIDDSTETSTTTIEWTLDRFAPDEPLMVFADGDMELVDVAELEPPPAPGEDPITYWDATVSIRGSLTVGDPITGITTATAGGTDASLRSGGNPTPWAGIREFFILRLENQATVPIDGNLRTIGLGVSGGSILDIAGTIEDPYDGVPDPEVPFDADLSKGTVRLDETWEVPEGAFVTLGEVTIEGTILNRGDVAAFRGETAQALATITGDLTVVEGASISGYVNGQELTDVSSLTVEGVLTVDGSIYVSSDDAPDELELRVVSTPNNKPEGTPIDIAVSRGEEDLRPISLDIRDDGYYVIGSGSTGGVSWADGDVLSVTQVVVDGDGEPVEVGLAWPAPAGAPADLVVERTELGTTTEVATLDPDAVSYVDATPVANATYRIVARNGGGTEVADLGVARVVYPAALGCTIVWTHAASIGSNGRWSDERNWAPYGTAGSASIAEGVRIPTLDDRACISSGDPDEGVIVDVDEPGTVVGSVVGDQAVIGVDRLESSPGTTFVAVADVEIDRLLVNGGAVAGVGGNLRTEYLGVGVGSSLGVGGTIEHADLSAVIEPGAAIDGGSVQSAGWSIPADGILALTGESIVAGPLTVVGGLILDPTARVELEALETTASATVSISIGDPGTAPRVDVVDAELDGALTVDLAQPLPDPSELLLIATTNPSSAMPTFSITGSSAGARLVADDSGVRLVRNSPTWAAGEVLEATSVTVDGDEAPVEVALAWPAPTGTPDRYAIIRTELGVSTTIGTVPGGTRTFVDGDPATTATYAVEAQVGDGAGGFDATDRLGDRRVYLADDIGCTLLWSEHVSGGERNVLWSDPQNWIPIGTAGSDSLDEGQRVPRATDDVCVGAATADELVLIDVVGEVAVAGSVRGANAYLAVNRAAALTPGSLMVSGAVDVQRVGAFEQGTVGVGADLEVQRLFAIGEDSLISVVGTIETGTGAPGIAAGAGIDGGAVSSAGWTLPEESDVDLAGEARILGPMTVGGRLDVASGSDVTIDDLTTTDTSDWRIAVGSLATAPQIDIPFGLSLDGVITVDLAEELPNPTDLHLVVSGAPPIGAPVTQVTGASAGARVLIGDDGVHVVRNAPEWGPDEAISVTALTVDGDGLPLSVALKWPVPSAQADRFEIVRTALGTDQVIGTTTDGFEKTFIDDDPLASATYTIRSIAGTETSDELGPVTVAFPSTLGCTIVATASADPSGAMDWHDDRNWAPYGLSGSASLAAGVRVPGGSDHACIELGRADGRRTVETAEAISVGSITSDPFTELQVSANVIAAGSGQVAQLVLDGAALVDFGGDLGVEHFTVLGGSGLHVAGKVLQPEPSVGTGDPGYRWGANVVDGTVSSDSSWTVPAGATLQLEAADVAGVLFVQGTVEVMPGAIIQVDDLDLGPDALLRSAFSAAAAPQISVQGALFLDGALDLELLSPLGPGAEVSLLTVGAAGSVSGSFATTTLSGDDTDTEIVVDSSGVRLVRAAAGGCVAVPDVAGLSVGGCWEQGPDDTYTAAPDPADPSTMPTLGDVVLDPADGTTLVLDLGVAPPTLRSDGPVDVGIDVALPGRVARWSAGTGAIDWDLGGAVALPTDRFFGSGLAAAPTLTPSPDGWQVRMRLRLPGLLGGGAADLMGTIGADGRLPNPSGSIGRTTVAEFGSVGGLSLTYADLNRWQFATPTPGIQATGAIVLGPGGPISGSLTLDGFGIGSLADLDGIVLQFSVPTSSWTADLDGAGGTRELRLLDIGGAIAVGSHVDLGTISLGFREQVGPIRIAKTGTGWSLPSVPAAGALLQQLDLSFRDGLMNGGTIRFGDVPPGIPATPPIATAGGWLPIGGLTVTYEPAPDRWTVEGFLDQPRVQIVGTIDLDDGRIEAGSFQIPNVDLGSLAVLDLTLAYTSTRTFSVVAVLEGPGLTGRPNGTGSITFAAGGGVTAGSLTFAQLPVGELFTIEQFRLAWSAPLGWWSVSGTVDGPDAALPPTAVSGQLSFTGGVLTTALLEVGDLRLGPLTIDQFAFSLVRTAASGPRESTYGLSGTVRGPAEPGPTGPTATADPITGSARLVDGQLTAFALSVPHIEVPGLAYLDNVNIGYSLVGGVATLSGAGTVSTASDGAGAGPGATFLAQVEDGRVLEARVSLDRLPLGGMLTIDAFVASYRASAELSSCSGFDGRNADVYSLSGSVRGSAVTGCAALVGRRLVGAQLEVDQLQVGELLAVDDFVATFVSGTAYVVPVVGGRTSTATLYRSSLSLSGSIAARGGPPTNFAGSMVLADGGLESLELSADVIPLSSTVKLQDVEVAYDGGGRFDERADLEFSISGSARHAGGLTTLSGHLQFGADGRLETGSVEIGDLPFGPVVLDDFAFRYQRTQSSTTWSVDAKVSAPDDRAVIFQVTGTATFTDGALTSASLTVPTLSVGEIVALTDLNLAFARRPDRSEVWSGSGTVAGQGQVANPARGEFRLELDANGGFRTGSITVEQVRWGGIFHLTGLSFTGSRTSSTVIWDVRGDLSVGGGSRTSVTGSLQLVDGRAVAGGFSLTNLSIAELVRVQRLDFSAVDREGITSWSVLATVALGEGAPITTQSTMAWERGVLTEGSLRLGNAPIGELLRLDDLRIEYQQGRLWSASATVADEDGNSTLGGSLQFTDGQVTGGTLTIANLQFGPLELSSFALTVGPADTPGPTVCGVADAAGSGMRYAVAATVRSRDGDTTSLAGRLRLDEGNFNGGVLCGNDIKFGDLLILDSVNLQYSSTVGANGRTISFSGAAVAQNPASPGATSSAQVAFAIRDRQLQTLSVTAAGLELGEFLKLANISFTFNRATSTTAWTFGATVVQDGADATLGGSLTVADGTIIGGSLVASEIRFGDLFVLEDVDIAYFGRESVAPTLGGVTAGANSSCGATPSDSNWPSGSPRGTGTYSQFRVSADVRANGDTFAARGQLMFGDGDLKAFDVTLACLPMGDFKTLEAVRIAKRPGQLEFSGRIQDPDGTSGASGSFVFDDGRLVGGEIELLRVPIGPIQLFRLEIAIGQTATGNTQYGLTVVLSAGESGPVGGGGSLIMNDGRLVAGSLNLSGIKVFDLFEIDQLELDIDGSVPGRVRFSVGLGLQFESGGSNERGGHVGQGSITEEDLGSGANVSVSMTMVDGRITAGSFSLAAVKLFDAVPLGRVSAEFDGDEDRWAAELEMQIGQNGPAFVLGAELQRGKLLSGTIGFDLNGDGQPDGSPGQSPPAGGNAQMTWFPLKAAYLVFCTAAATASYCPGDGVSKWAGRLAIELPTDAAPAIDVSIEVRDGILVEASAWIDFGIGIPVYPPVWLESLGFGFGLRPFLATGTIGLALGTGVVDIADVVGWVAAGEGPLLGPSESPLDYEPDYIYFASGGTVELFDLPVGGSFVSIFQSNGYLGFGGDIGIDIMEDTFTVLGGMEGAIFNASGEGFDLTHPETDEPLTGWHAQAHGWVSANIFGMSIASADAYISDIGATAFGQVVFLGCTGVGVYWSTGNVRETCDYTRYIVEGVNPTDSPLIPNSVQGNGLRSDDASTSVEVEYSEFEVAPGEDVLGVTVSGFGSALEKNDPTPDVTLMAPDGTLYGAQGVDDADPNDGTIVASAPNNRWFFIADPQPGTWRMESAPGSVPIEEVALSRKLPPVDVRGSVTPDGEQVVLDYALTPLEGQEVLFVERSIGGTDRFESGIGTASGRSGQLRFTPAGGSRGGEREAVAVVMQEGFPRKEISLGTFTVGTGKSATEPRQVAVTEIAGGARVSWQPPAYDGGRRITSYRVFSDLGFDVTVDADERSVELPIPAMEPGERVPVYVEARTGVGWGYSGKSAFTSTQTTGWQYEQYQVPTSDWVDDPGPGPDPDDPSDPDDPDGSGPGGSGSTSPTGMLARTGSNLITTWWWGVLLVLIGSAFSAFGRRRGRRPSPPTG